MNSDWHYRWNCECGHSFGEGNSSTHLMFGFSKPCPKCGDLLGSHWPNRTTKRLARWVRPIPFKLLNIETWFVDWKLEYKEKK